MPWRLPYAPLHHHLSPFARCGRHFSTTSARRCKRTSSLLRSTFAHANVRVGQREVKLECKVNVAEWGERAGAPSPLCAPSVCGYDRLQRCIRGGHLWRCLAFHCLANVFDVLQESMLIRMASMEHQTCAGRRCRGWRLCSHCRWPCTPGYTSHRPTAAQRANGGVVHQHGPRSDRGSQQEVAHDT